MLTGKTTNGFVANRREDDIARGLGWFSIALGLVQLLAPRQIGRAVGVGNHALVMRLIGLREIATGLGILTQARPGPWFKTRVAGDMLDLTLLGAALTSPGSQAGRLAIAGAAVAGVTSLDWRTSRDVSGRGVNFAAIHVLRSVTIDRPAEELFRFWRNFENLPRIMTHLQTVTILDEKRSHWVAKGPAGTAPEWEAEIVTEHPNQLISWRSTPASKVTNAGSVRFTSAPGNRGTVVKLELQYNPPAGVLGATFARLFGQSPEKQVAIDLHRFKQLMETGEIARTEGQPSGRKKAAPSRIDQLVRA
jgi:uncharacterized membrane protein